MAHLHLALFAAALAYAVALPSVILPSNEHVALPHPNVGSGPQNRVKRGSQAPCAGCAVETTPNEGHKKLAQESLDKYLQELKNSNGGTVMSIREIKITKVTEQVVAGSKTVIDFDVYPTEGQKFSCHSDIWEKPWEKFKQIDVNCDYQQ